MHSIFHNKQARQFTSLVKKQQGFTLIELIIGIVILTISLAIVSTLIAPADEKSADNVLQIKASELAQSLMNDITSRAFDDNSDMSGGRVRCDEAGTAACTTTLGPETGEDNRNLFDDVDDFHNYSDKKNSTGDDIDGGYDQFKISVKVIYAGEDLGLANRLAKRITVTVTTPLGTEIEFTSHKANF
ncbi:prepilin-type N-terminal cleavage/methylation domain-containing protein [Colwellia sp. E2M01]|uniref:prepilin-type N-terminal cleavage/methylation domain-containing protein n=1 Tax=Colwellia sp. E2M01 TaxID=2841561 RepID=UPI001C082F48|nr:prepilin-type N-terminal cleavage/methylation domain-containing protein [Colwellia sp. E2M01]MBU2870301.1 prepilin-type N-terminal cleavage/methylation domain-containing protein [Colwellia sp. E2M01]